MSFRRKQVKSGGPSAKSNQQVYCSHCYEAGTKEVESCVLKKNMTKHMKRFHMMLADNNHRLAKKVKETESLVLKRLRKKAKTEHTSKIFL